MAATSAVVTSGLTFSVFGLDGAVGGIVDGLLDLAAQGVGVDGHPVFGGDGHERAAGGIDAGVDRIAADVLDDVVDEVVRPSVS
ncbi:MAG: hypothetical protein U0R24_12685 [Solirubrobacterales bacterium]